MQHVDRPDVVTRIQLLPKSNQPTKVVKKISRLKELKLNRASFPVHKLQKLRLEDVRCSYMINAMISGYSATAAAAAAAE